MVSLRIRLIREHNRLYKCWMRFLWRLYGMDAPIVLMVHRFKPSKEECQNAFEMTSASFERLMHYLANEGWHAMTQGELLSGKWARKSFYLTFDDVYDTVYSEALPILQRFDIPFTVFITTDLVDKPGFITQEHLDELQKNPLCMIGGHGRQHVVFRNLSSAEFERQTDDDQPTFAFPYGRIVEVSFQNRRQIRNRGYQMAFSAIEGTLNAKWFTGRYFLPRVNVSERFVKKFTSGKFPRFKDCEGR